MKKQYLFLLIVSLCLFSLPMHAANLVAILVGDTNDDILQNDSREDFDRMARLVKKIARHTELDLIEVKIKGKQFTPENILDQVQNIHVGNDDAVIFYYTGHGYRMEEIGSSPWPIFDFSDKGLESRHVMDILEEKKPRLLLAIHDCCNVFLEEDEEEPLLLRAIRVKQQDENVFITRNYRRLFLEARGVIKVASASIGEYSYTTEERHKDGGKYTIAFLKSLNKELKSSHGANWESLLIRAADLVDDDEQHPIWVMDLN